MKSITLEEMKKIPEEQRTLLDIRGEIAYRNGHIPGAVLYDETMPESSFPKDRLYIVYCTYGERSEPVVERLEAAGFSAANLAGGYGGWLRKEASFLERYERQMILPEIGMAGQQKLRNARILVVGAGGLGCPALSYLAGAGVGTLGIVDADAVSISNLHRQVLHPEKNVGKNKADSAAEMLRLQNSAVRIHTYPFFLNAYNAEEILGDYDFIIDAVDNFETKFLINDTCVLLGKPFCHAGVLQFHGQVMTYVPGEGPCLRCIFGEIPERGSIETCSQAGVIGAAAGICGSIQAMEAVKYLTGAGRLLTGAMYIFDALTLRSRIAKFPNPSAQCRVCGPHADITDICKNAAEYTWSCAS